MGGCTVVHGSGVGVGGAEGEGWYCCLWSGEEGLRGGSYISMGVDGDGDQDCIGLGEVPDDIFADDGYDIP